MSEDNSWVFDSLVCFLHGPIWNAPLQTFIEEKSLIFDPNERSDDDNPEYRKIHDEYKNLVDYMLGSFMEEMQISPELFEIACLEGRQNGPNGSISFHQGLFQQIWAANDIRIFIRMMIQRNVELQLQALDLIERRHNSLEDDEAENSKLQHQVVEVVTKDDIEKLTSPDETTEKEIFQSVENELKGQTNDAVAQINSDQPLEKETTTKPIEKYERLNLFFETDKVKVSEADIKARQEYLRAQRDKILEIKKKARAYQLNESVKKNGRPTSAQAAEKILRSGGLELVGPSVETKNDASLQLRKTLAKRLRDEVVESK